MYSTVQDLVAHADKLWQTLDLNKVCQEIKNKRAHHQHQSDQCDQSDQSDQSEQHFNQIEKKLQDFQNIVNLFQ